MARQILQITNLTASYKGFDILKYVNMTVYEGEIVAIIGPNGAGKSTILKAIMNIVNVVSGTILFYDRNITRQPTWKTVRQGIAYSPQNDTVFKNMTVFENLKIGVWALDRHLNKQEFDQVLDIFEPLKKKLALPAKKLSGGEQRMVGLARALLQKPKLLLLDEPSLGLAPWQARLFFQALNGIQSKGITTIVVEHRLKEVFDVADKVCGLKLGKLNFECPSTSLGKELVRNLYL